MQHTFNELISYVQSNDRVCPVPMVWQELYEILSNTKKKPPPPLILGAWWHSTDNEKAQRLIAHIKHADENGAFKEIASFILSIPDSDWHKRDKRSQAS